MLIMEETGQNARAGRALGTELDDPTCRPYFLWNEPMTVGELRERLAHGSREERLRLMALILREARDTDVWRFLTPDEVAANWQELVPRLGRRRGFWELLLASWEETGKLRRARPVTPPA